MLYYLIYLDTDEDPAFCFLDALPEGLGIKSYKLGHGKELGPEYPADARIYMSDRYKGIQVPDLVGNTHGMLVTSKRVKEAFEQVNRGPVEYLPVAIYNHKKRVASPDHFILNPLGTVDCLNLEASDIVYHQDKVVRVRNFVLDPEKLQGAPDLFRVREDSYAYLMSDRVLQELRGIQPRVTNFVFEELDQVPSKPPSARRT